MSHVTACVCMQVHCVVCVPTGSHVDVSNTRYTQHMHNTLTSAYVVRAYAMETLSVRVCLYIGRVVGARVHVYCVVWTCVRVCSVCTCT